MEHISVLRINIVIVYYYTDISSYRQIINYYYICNCVFSSNFIIIKERIYKNNKRYKYILSENFLLVDIISL
jgi:hypothetical protein